MTTPHEFILASSNPHKAQELNRLLRSGNFSIKASEKKIEVIEDGKSFSENAFKKAKAYFEILKKPVVSDDSGLTVEALPDDLGIYSARFGGPGKTDEQRAKLLLERLNTEELLQTDKRKAAFICYLCFYFGPDEVYFFEGRLNGIISQEYRGDSGFGYDPVFIPNDGPEDKTLAEIPQWKEEHSHRALASKQALKFLEKRLHF